MRCQSTWLAALFLMLATAEVTGQGTASSLADPMAALSAGRYDELDAALTAVQNSYKRGSISDEQLIAAFRPFYDVSNPEIERYFDGWVNARPKSYVARLARGIHHKYVGLASRGSERAHLVPDASWKSRNAAYALAAKDLAGSIHLDEKPLLSYQYLIDPSGSLLTFTSNRGLLDKAIALDSGNLIVRRKYLSTLPERWGGSLAEMEKFLRECQAANLSPGQLGNLEYDLEYERALLVYEKGQNFARAEQMFANLLATDPDDFRVAQRLTTSLVKQKKWSATIAATSQLLERQPQDSHALASRGLAYVFLNEFDRGVSDYEAAAALGNVWAQKELARLHWQGRLVEKDRQRALRLLRRAAEDGDHEAQAEFKRVTGERIVTQRPMILQILFFMAPAIPLLVVGALIVFMRQRVSLEVLARRLSHSPQGYFAGAIGLVLSTGALIKWSEYPGGAGGLFAFLAYSAIALISLPGFISYLFVRHDLTADGLLFTRLNGRRDKLIWKEIERVSYQPFPGLFKLRMRTRTVAHVSDRLINIGAFADEVLNQVPQEVIDGDAFAMLMDLRQFNALAKWSREDIEAQAPGAIKRLVLSGGTGAGEMVLFSAESLLVADNHDEESISQLENEHLAIRLEVHRDGDYLMHLYVDLPVPSGVLKYRAPLENRRGTLHVGTGRIAFGGLESMSAEFRGDPDIRTYTDIAPGTYSIEFTFIAYPRAMLAAATEESLHEKRTAMARCVPIICVVAALAGIGVSVFEDWWTGAALLVLAAIGATMYYRSDVRGLRVSQARASLLNFPDIVAVLRTI